MFRLWTTAVLGTTLILAACNTLPMGTDQPQQASLKATTWQLSQLNGQTVSIDSAVANRPHLMFSPELRISGATGCNRLMGQAQVNGNQLKLDQLGMTKRACPGDRLEIPFVAALNKTQQYQIVDNQLRLKDATGRVLAVFTASPTPAQ